MTSSRNAQTPGVRRKPVAHAVGCGIDIVEIERFRRVLKRSGEAFLRRVFTPGERAYAQRHRQAVLHLAARFAAKEAVIKAMAQVDPAHPLVVGDIEIQNDALGRPSARLRNRTRQPMICISLSHVESVAVATAIAQPQWSRRRRAR